MTCAHCGKQVPDGRYCTGCGAAQQATSATRRPYAAHPGEDVIRLNVLSTLLPHLSADRVHEFRWAFVAGLVSLTILYLLGLIAAAILLGAVLVPALYVLYLHEARVYGDEPAPVLLTTVGGGGLLGIAVTAVVGRAAGVLTLVPVSGALVLLLLTVLAPAVQELIKPIPALLLRRRPRLGEPVDGLALGIAAGLGFASGQTLAGLAPVIAALPFRVDPAAWIYPLVAAAILLPMLQGACTGAFTIAVWRSGGRRPALLLTGVPVAVAAHIAFSLGAQLLAERGPGHIAVLIWEAAVVSALIVYARALLHRALLAEGAALHLGELVCGHCAERVVAGRFCPRCGLALAAAPRSPAATPGAAPPAGG